MKVRAELSETETRKTIEKKQCIQNSFLSRSIQLVNLSQIDQVKKGKDTDCQNQEWEV